MARCDQQSQRRLRQAGQEGSQDFRGDGVERDDDACAQEETGGDVAGIVGADVDAGEGHDDGEPGGEEPEAAVAWSLGKEKSDVRVMSTWTVGMTA